MSKKGIDFDTTLWKKRSRDVIKILKIDEPKFVKEQASLLAKTLSKATPPFNHGQFPELKGAKWQGGSVKETVEAGLRAIKHDMGVLFKIKEEGYLLFLQKLTGKTRNIRRELKTKSGKTYLVDVDIINHSSVSSALKFHWQKRLSNGRVSGYQKGGKDPIIGRWTARDKMWITEDIWKKVYAKLSANVGLSKAAFAKVAVRLGAKRAPKYINKHFSKVSARITFQKNPVKITMRASAPGLDHTRRALGRVERFRMTAMEKRLESLVRAAAKKSGFKVKR